MISYEIATANLPARRMTPHELRSGLDAVLVKKPRYAALQEVGPDNDALLRDVARAHGCRLVRAEGGPPVLYDAQATEVLRVNARTLARGGVMSHLAGRKSALPPSVATEAIFEDDLLGQLAFIDAHLTAEVQANGTYRHDAEHQDRVRRHQAERRGLHLRELHHRQHGRRVFACMDSNFDGLQLQPLISCWAGRDGEGTLEGPNGNLSARAVDIVFASVAAVAVDRIVTGSDHRAVVATYKEKS